MNLLSATLLRALCLSATLLSAEAARASAWNDALKARVERIDAETTGRVGLYVKRLDNGETFSYRADRRWYLASSIKLPIAIAVLQEVEAGKRRLDDKLVLAETDKVDGSGNLVWQQPGTAYRVDALLQRMLMVSDNTAANLLIRGVGIEPLNRGVAELLGPKAFDRLTDFTQVRYDIYAELHPAARRLTNRQLVQVAGAPMGPQRVDALRRALGVAPDALQARTVDDAYARYYARHLNEASLEGYGGMLERLVTGKLLSAPSMKRLYTDLKYDTYDAYRLEAGLPRTVRFIHKTGTQYQRACHMGVIEPQDGGRRAIVVATCAEGLDEHDAAGKMFERIGRAISETLLGTASTAAPAR